MTQDEEVIVDRRQSSGVSPEHDIAIFHTWKRYASGYTWTRAVVDKQEGLTLCYDYDEFTITELNFQHAQCGYIGEGSRTAFIILSEAGFGVMDPEDMRQQINTQDHCEFTRTK
jgi:hypothetical protein